MCVSSFEKATPGKYLDAGVASCNKDAELYGGVPFAEGFKRAHGKEAFFLSLSSLQATQKTIFASRPRGERERTRTQNLAFHSWRQIEGVDRPPAL